MVWPSPLTAGAPPGRFPSAVIVQRCRQDRCPDVNVALAPTVALIDDIAAIRADGLSRIGVAIVRRDPGRGVVSRS